MPTEETIMTDGTHIKNIFEPNPMGGFAGYGLGGAGAGAGAGLGAGLLGGVLGGSLLNRGGLFNGGGGEPCVTPMQLQTATGSIIDSGR